MKKLVTDTGLADHFEIDSAGTYGGHRGEKADSRMREAASKRGYNLTSRSRQITYNDFQHFDMIVVMDDSNYEQTHRLAPDIKSAQKIFRMCSFCQQIKADHVPDPYYEGASGFEKVLDILEDACRGVLKKV